LWLFGYVGGVLTGWTIAADFEDFGFTFLDFLIMI
jgi:hypothetical protein